MQTPTLRGELVTLRPIRADDADAMWEMVTDPDGIRLTGRRPAESREELGGWCARAAGLPGRMDWAITHDTDEYLGEIVLNQVDPVDSRANLRMAMRPGQRGRGFGRESISLVLAKAFGEPSEGLGLHRVSLDVLSINTRARVLYDSLGFVEEGRLRETHRDGEFWCDTIVMAILEEDYRTAREAAP